MEPQQKAALVIFVAVLVVIGVAGFYIATSPQPPTLPIPAGSVISRATPSASFTVFGRNARLVGAWYSPDGGAVVVRSTSITTPVHALICVRPWHGTINQTFVPGSYAIWLTSGGQGGMVVTQTIQLVYPGGSNATGFYSDGSCGSAGPAG